MAKYKKGILGGFSGRVGNVVGATCRGVDYIRSRPEPTSQPTTEKQRNQRLKFALVTGWLRPLSRLINIGFQTSYGNRTPMNLAISHHLMEAVKGEGRRCGIDFPKAVFSRGELLVSWVLEVLCLADALVHIKWENGPASAFCKDSDKAGFVIYNPRKREFVTFEGVALRSDREASLQLPAKFDGDIVHGWMQYVNVEGDRVSTSVYLGEVVVRGGA